MAAAIILSALAAALSAFLLRALFYKTVFFYAVKERWRSAKDRFHVHQTFRVPAVNDAMQENLLYRKVSAYLHSLPSVEASDNTNLFTGRTRHDTVLGLDPGQVVPDTFFGAHVTWLNDAGPGHTRSFVLRIRKADRRRILRPYLQHIHTVSEELDQRNRELRLYVNIGRYASDTSSHCGRWQPVPFDHPATFETIAMEPDLKNRVKSDLELFLKSEQYYHRLGRSWKRSFLLYGPSGTGKSTFVAAMANFLAYDVYDIDLSRVVDDADLRTLLLEISRQSVVVIEDLDQFLLDKPRSVSLPGLLNFMDGMLSSCCAEERIMVFTMNSKDHIDPAILRPGRIDLHIHFPLCDFSSFKSLANSCLGVTDHKLFPQVEEMIQTGVRLSAAEIGELMITNRNSPNRALKSVITALKTESDSRVLSKIGQRLYEDVSLDSSSNSTKDIKRLCGFLSMKSSRKSSGPSPDHKSVQNGG